MTIFQVITNTIAVLFPSNLYKARLPMQNTKKLALAVLVQLHLISTAFASEQSESKGFVEDAEGSVLIPYWLFSIVIKKMVTKLTDTSSFCSNCNG